VANLWLTKQDAADLLGKQHEFVRTQVISRMPDSGKRRGRGRGAPWELLGSAVVSAYVEYVAEMSTGDPETYASTSSPAMERQRLARAKILEWELAERQNELMSVELFQRAAASAMTPLRRFAEEQIKEHGNGTADAWNEAIEEFDKEMESVIGQSIDSDGEEATEEDEGSSSTAIADAAG
jgi:hypothetical protein